MDYFGYFKEILNDDLYLMLFIFMIIVMIWMINYTITVIGKWKMFKKAGKEGWPALIPIYDTVILCEITGVNPWWIVITIIARTVGGLIPVMGLTLAIIASIYFKVVLYVSTARSYGKSDAWAIGLYFLRPFFFFALGVGKSEYKGAIPLSDPILEAVGINKPSEVKETKEKEEEKVNCKNCGELNLKSSTFCTSCGKKL